MSQRPEPRKELPSTYFVQDRANIDERKRVQLQDMLLTHTMGGVLPEQTDPARLHRVIDIGCGTGNWLIELARAYPEIEQLIGVDISQRMIEYAHRQAQTEHVAERVEFQVMDILSALDFPQGHFDLLNQRMGLGYLRTWDWPNVLSKYQRVTRSGGVIRITESDISSVSTSPALTQFNDLSREAFYRAGHLFTPERDSVASKLPELFRQHGIRDVQTRKTLLEYHPGAELMDNYFENVKLVMHTIVPFLRKWGHVPDNYDTICQQALYEMQQPDCLTTWQLVTIWGSNP
jgi:ubiquinone/menaquinone biosynthesis C-methylase UbiE